MYQTVGHEVIDLLAQALELPLFRRTITGTAVEHGLAYTQVCVRPVLSLPCSHARTRDHGQNMYHTGTIYTPLTLDCPPPLAGGWR